MRSDIFIYHESVGESCDRQWPGSAWPMDFSGAGGCLWNIAAYHCCRPPVLSDFTCLRDDDGVALGKIATLSLQAVAMGSCRMRRGLAAKPEKTRKRLFLRAAQDVSRTCHAKGGEPAGRLSRQPVLAGRRESAPRRARAAASTRRPFTAFPDKDACAPRTITSAGAKN